MRQVYAWLLVIVIVCSFSNVAFAQSAVGKGNTQTFSTQTLDGQGFVKQNIQYSTDPKAGLTDAEAKAISSAGLPSVKAEQVSNWAERKGFDIVSILQTVAQPLAIVSFIICAFMALFGAFGNGKLVSVGLVGMMIACIMYAVVLYAPEIMNFFMEWVRE